MSFLHIQRIITMGSLKPSLQLDINAKSFTNNSQNHCPCTSIHKLKQLSNNKRQFHVCNNFQRSGQTISHRPRNSILSILSRSIVLVDYKGFPSRARSPMIKGSICKNLCIHMNPQTNIGTGFLEGY